MRHIRLVMAAFLTLLGAGCGSGGGSTAVNNAPGGTAVVVIRTEASAAVHLLYAAEFTLALPAGVTVAADGSSGEVATGAGGPLHVADASALAAGRYQPAAGTTPATVHVVLADPNGFGVGDLATVTCTVAPGTALAATGFSLQGFSAKDFNGASISGVTPHLALQAQ